MNPRQYESIIKSICENGGITLDSQYLVEVELNLWVVGGATDELHIDMRYHQRDENRLILDKLRGEIIELDKEISLNPFKHFEDVNIEGVYFGGWRFSEDDIDLLIFEGAYGVRDTYQALSLAKRLKQLEIYHLGLKQSLSIGKLEELMGGLL